ncbi:YbaB/EbfC family nucleoid-associated protein, partial [Acinetobacter baumannii]
QERAERAAELRRQIDAVRGVATSPRREVTVTGAASGRLAAVELTDAASPLPSRDLGRLIVHTANEAQRQAGEKALELASEAFGADS